MMRSSQAGRCVRGVVIALLLLGLTACGPSVDLRGTIWSVTAIEGADEMSTGQWIEFPDATSVQVTWACGESQGSLALNARAGSLTAGAFRAVWETAGCPAQIAAHQGSIFDVLAAVTGWRVVSVDVIELTGGPVIRLERLPDSDMHRIGVKVTGPGGGWPEHQLVLRIGQQSWAIEPGSGGGVAWPFINRQVSVQVLRSSDCAVLTSFLPPLDLTWLIRFTSETDATFTDVASDAFEGRPLPEEIDTPPCPWP
jgi:hypothetical protein